MLTSWYVGLIFFTALAVAAIVTPPLTLLAYRKKIVDRPGRHKPHSASKLLLGGLAIFFGFLLTVVIFTALGEPLPSLILGALLLVVVGLYDDIYDLPPLIKLSAQVLTVSLVVYGNGERLVMLEETFISLQLPALIVLPLAVGFVVLAINAFNLIYGLDGLAAGTGAILFTTLASVTIIRGGDLNMFYVQVIGAGVCSGFLFFNFEPAQIFMGDTGSMLLGYLLSTSFLFSLNSEPGGAAILGAILIFGYPVFDTFYAIYRRLREGRSILKADRGHIHHLLIKLGFTASQAVLILYTGSIVFALFAFLILTRPLLPAVLVLIVSVVVGVNLLGLKLLIVLSTHKALGLNATEAKGRSLAGGEN